MKRVVLSLLLACAACAPAPAPTESENLAPVTLPQADDAGNRLEALTENGEARWCSADNWCVEAGGDTPPYVSHADQAITLPAPEDDERVSVWPQIVRLAEGDGAVLIGLLTAQDQMYSGGGATVTGLTLFRIENGAAHAVAALPVSSEISTRACFSDEDVERRREACLDQYEFQTRISLDDSVQSGPPAIMLETTARSFPGRRSRDEDSTSAPALTEADLVWAPDAVCSYERTFRLGADGLYAADEPLPPCSDYLEP